MTHPIKLSDLFEPGLLEKMLSDGYVREQVHPSEPLRILNYSEKAAYEREWNPVTRTCRGLIYHTDTGEIVARPFPKFWNTTEPESGALDLTEKAVVYDKADGCFPRQTALNLWGGGTITIGEVVRKRLPVTLVGMNESGELVPALITDWHDNGRKDQWLDVEVDAPVSRTSGAAGHPNRLRVTVNHHILVNGEYRPASEVRPGDTLVTQTWEPSAEVVNLVRASLLGDGCLVASVTKPTQAKYQEPHTIKQTDYVHVLRKVLGDCAANRRDTTSGYGSTMVWAGSRGYAALGTLRREWYPDGVKRVPADLSWLDDFAVAKWLMDDGHRQHFRLQADRISFATHSFPREDIVRLGDRLAEMYGVTYYLYDDGGRGLALVVNSGRRQQIAALWQAIAPHVHPSMRYKLPDAYQNIPYVEMAPGREIVVPRSTTVVSVARVEPTKRNFPHGRTGYDITTTTSNYLARGVLVHNSLAVVYPTPDGPAIATRGSFASDQAVHATEVLRTRYGTWAPPAGMTVLAEIIYPENRIVVDYAGMDDLVLLGAVDISTGRTFGPDAVLNWPGPVVQQFPYATLAEALAAPVRDNAEGFVIWFPDRDVRTKAKYEAYVALHKIVTGLTARVVWQHMVEGNPLADLIAQLPDEFHAWCREVADGITAEVVWEADRIKEVYNEALGKMPEGWVATDRTGRKDFAMVAAKHPDKWALFALLDGHDIRPELLKRAQPGPFLSPTGRTYTEDTA